MIIDTFLQNFELLADAPNSVPKLRKLILQLAVQGKLVPQDPSDESAAILVKKIRLEKVKLIQEKKLRKEKPLPDISLNEFPFPIPSNWSWVRLGDIGDWGAGATPDRKNPDYYGGQIKWFKSGELNDGYIDDSEEKITEEALTNCSLRSNKPGDILIAMYGATIGKVAVLNSFATTNQAVCACTCFAGVYNRFLFLLLKAYRSRFSQQGAGGAQPNISRGKIIHTVVPLPPLAEQQRIVAKVDELMALCDKLEAQQQERETLCKITRTAILYALANAEDSLKLEVAWARTDANMGLLLDCEQGFIDLQYSLTKLAVRGFLSNWTKESPPLDEIKEECSSLKQEYIYKGWLRTRKPVAPKLHENDAYPPHWGILPLDEVAVIIGGITKGHKLRGEDVRSCVYLSVANVQRGFFDLTEMKHIEVPIHQIEKYRVESGDLLIAEGGDWDKVGRTAIWAGEIPDCLHQNHIFKARVPSPLLLNEWVELVLNSEIGRDYFAGASKQTTNLASINMTQLRSFPLPIPPIAEQIAILQRVNHLLSICQKLEQQRLESHDVAGMLASAAISSITGIQIEEKEKMKVPKTELVSTLRVGVSPANSERAPLAAILIRNNGEIPAKILWQASGLEIDAFYQQLKTEMAKGWIVQPEVAYMREVEAS